MTTSLWSRLFRSNSRPATQSRLARIRFGVEMMETPRVPIVFAGISNSQDLTIYVKPARTEERVDSEAASARDRAEALDSFLALLAGAWTDHHDGK